jgi:hypothetical protein
MKTKNIFGIWRPHFILSPEAILEQQEPIESLLNMGTIISKDFQGITMQKQNQFSKEPQLYVIECPEGYMRYLTNSPILPLFFAKPTNKGIFPSTNLDLDSE